MSDSKENISAKIKEEARKLGFDFIGFSKAEKLNQSERLQEWLKAGYQGQMAYLENHFEKRLNPTELVQGGKTVISVLYNYYPEKTLPSEGYKIARYAYGRDYHKVIKKKLNGLVKFIEQIFPELNHRVFVDSAPIMERQWAAKSGLGWLGKNTLLINKEKGSYFFLAEIVINQELQYDGPIADYCGTCTKCLDACPTDAFEGPYVLNASKCISYHTIELKDALIDDEYKGKFDNWIFGCDICQEVCPWNSFSEPHKEVEFLPNSGLLEMDDEKWRNLSEEKFNELFPGSAVKRTKYQGLKRNIKFLSSD